MKLPPTYNTHYEIWQSSQAKDALKTKKANFVDEISYPVCDLGEENKQKEIMEKHLGIKMKSVYGFDFNYEPIPGKWGTIFCSDILEHVLNPLLFLRNIRKSLNQDGILYLSIPGRPHFLWTEHHFHEIDDIRMKWLFDWDEVNFRIEKFEKIRMYNGIKWHLRGLRPILRLNTFTRLYKLR